MLVQLSHVGAALGVAVAVAVGGLLLLLLLREPSGRREEAEETEEAPESVEPPPTRPARDGASPRDDVDAPKDMASNAGARQ